jgi:hypothetical protein
MIRPGCRGPVDAVEVGGLEIEVFEQHLADVVRTVMADLEADGLAFEAIAHFLFDRAEQVLHFLALDVEFAIAGDTDVPVPENLHAGEEATQGMGDDPAQKQVFLAPIGPGQADEARQILRHLHDAHLLLRGSARGVHEFHHDVEHLVQQEREGMGLVDGERRQNRMHPLAIE